MQPLGSWSGYRPALVDIPLLHYAVHSIGYVTEAARSYKCVTQLLFRKLGSVPLRVPVAARSKAYVYGLSPAEIVGSNPTGGMDVCLL